MSILRARLFAIVGLLFAIGALGACDTTKPQASCSADDLDCFMSHLVIRDANGVDVPVDWVDPSDVTRISAVTHGSASSPLLTGGPGSLVFAYGTEITGVDVLFTARMDLSFSDPNGCQPVVALTLAKNGKSSTHTGCFPGLRDHRTSGSFTRNLGFSATAPDGASFDLQMAVLSSTNCLYIDQPVLLLTDNGAHALGVAGTTDGVFANNPISIPVTIAPPPSGGTTSGGTCTASWDCGASSQCITAMGTKTGTAGPFASLAACNQWRQSYFAGAVCSAGCQ